MTLPKKSSLTKEELEQAAWLKQRPTLDESRNMMRDGLTKAFDPGLIEEWRENSYGALLAWVKNRIFQLEYTRLSDRLELVCLCAILAAKANLNDSPVQVASMLDAAWGFYVKVEPTRGDSWRDIPLSDLMSHAKHEVLEIERGDTLERRLHNSLDLTALAAIIYLRSRP